MRFRAFHVAIVSLLVGLSMATSLCAQTLPSLGNNFFSVEITHNDKPLLKGSIFKDSNDHLIVKGAALANVIAEAYGLRDYQVVDGPDWIYATHLYDIEAVPPPVFVDADEERMLQNLLADNFALDAHMATRELSMLVLARDESVESPEASAGLEFIAPAARYALFGPGGGRIRGLAPMSMLIARLSRTLGEPLLDMTGLQGVYEFDLEGVHGEPESYRASLREQLGLKLERRTLPIEVLVIDRIVRPELDY